MQQVTRKFGKLVSKDGGNAEVGQLIADFQHADGMLTLLIDNARSWKQAWLEILSKQLSGTVEFETIYGPIVGEGGTGRPGAETPRSTMQRTTGLKELFDELKTDMLQELDAVETKFIGPALEARTSIKPLHKVIKKREDRKLDYERYKSRVDAVNQKSKRSERDDRQLVKHEADLSGATTEYEVADEQLRKSLPPVTAAVNSMLPDLLATIVTIQHTLLAQCYTVLFNYCSENGIPSQPQQTSDITADFEAAFTPLRQELEGSFKMLQQGKTVHTPMGSSVNQAPRSPSFSSSVATRRPSGQRAPSQAMISPAASQYNDSLTPPPPAYDLASKPRIGSPSPPYPVDNKPPYPVDNKPRIPSMSKASSSLQTPSSASLYRSPSPLQDNPWANSASPAAPNADYFARGRMPSNGSSVAGVALPGIAKKKPPPPPPKKKPGQYVTALYDYNGEGDDELSFREGDKIKVIKKTDSVNDWWEGELRGMAGSFPANYVQIDGR